jgi:hypothetical protein
MCSRFGGYGWARRPWWFIFGLPFILAFLALAGLVLMLLWNSVVTDIFAIKAIGYWQSVGLIVIARILLGGFHHRRPAYYHDRGGWDKWRKWHGEEPGSTEKESPESSPAK